MLFSMRGRNYALVALALLGIGLALGAATPDPYSPLAPEIVSATDPLSIDNAAFDSLTAPLAPLAPALTLGGGDQAGATLPQPDYRALIDSDLTPAVAPLPTEAEAPPSLPLDEELARLVRCFRINSTE